MDDEASSESKINPDDYEVANAEQVKQATATHPTLVFRKKPLNDKEPGKGEIPDIFKNAFKGEDAK
jgi:hypothetical protein